MRNGVGRTDSEWKGIEDRRILLRMVAYRITETARFTELVNKYQGFRGRVVESGDTDMMRWIEGIGLDESSQIPLASNLARYWEKLGFFKTFSGVRYHRIDKSYKTRSEADRKAERLRQEGNLVRVTKELVSVLGLYVSSWASDLDFEYVLWKRRKR